MNFKTISSIIAITLLHFFSLETLSAQNWTTYRVNSTSTSISGFSVQCAIQDANGVKWFGTEDGISRYENGVWSRFLSTDGVPGRTINTMAFDNLGNMWFATLEGGLGRITGNTVTQIAMPSGVASGKAIVFDNNDNLYLCHATGVSMFNGSVWQAIGGSTGLANANVQAIAKDNNGLLYIGTSTGLFIKNGVNIIQERNAPFGSNQNVTAIGIGPNNEVGLGVGSTFYIGQNRTYNQDTRISSSWGGYRCITFGNGMIGLGTSNGALIFDGADWTQLRINSNVASVLFGANNEIWMGAISSGLIVQRGATSTWYGPNGIQNHSGQSIHKDINGNILVGSSYGYSTRTNGNWRNGLFPSNANNQKVNRIVKDAYGNVFFANMQGLYKQTPSGLALQGSADGISVTASTRFEDITLDRQGCAIVSISNGVFKYTGSTWVDALPGSGSSSQGSKLAKIAVDSTGAIWIAYRSSPGYAIARHDGAGWTIFLSTAGASPGAVNDMEVDANGILWVATASRGLLRYDGIRWTEINANSGLPSSNLLSVTNAPDGKLWVGSDAGFSIYDGSTFTNYNTNNSPLAGNMVYSVFFDRDNGDIWIGTQDGINQITNFPLSIAGETLETKSFKLYPNPSSSEVYLEISEFGEDELSYSIINPTGSVLKAGAIQNSAVVPNVLDVSGLPAGLYFVRLNSGKAQAVQRLLKL